MGSCEFKLDLRPEQREISLLLLASNMTVVEGAMVVSIFRQVVLGLGTGIVLYALVSLVKVCVCQ